MKNNIFSFFYPADSFEILTLFHRRGGGVIFSHSIALSKITLIKANYVVQNTLTIYWLYFVIQLCHFLVGSKKIQGGGGITILIVTKGLRGLGMDTPV